MDPISGGMVVFLVAFLAAVLLLAGLLVAVFRGARKERRVAAGDGSQITDRPDSNPPNRLRTKASQGQVQLAEADGEGSGGLVRGHDSQ